jgi:hypothetical protein
VPVTVHAHAKAHRAATMLEHAPRPIIYVRDNANYAWRDLDSTQEPCRKNLFTAVPPL